MPSPGPSLHESLLGPDGKNLVKTALRAGLFPDLAPGDSPLFVGGKNILFSLGGVSPWPALSGVTVNSNLATYDRGWGNIVGGIEIKSSTQTTHIFCGTDIGKLIYLQTQGEDDYFDPTWGTYTPLESYGPTTRWFFEQIGDNFAYSNGKKLYAWEWIGSGSEIDSEGAPTNFRTSLFVNGHYLAIGFENNLRRLTWCSQEDITLWDPQPENTAGGYTLRDFPDSLIAAAKFSRDRFMLFGSSYSLLGSYIGTPYIFGFEPGPSGTGTVGPEAVVAAGGYIYGMNKHFFWRTDGVTVEQIDNGAVSDFLRTYTFIIPHFDTTIRAAHFAYLQSVCWFLRFGNSGKTLGLLFNYKTGTWTILDFGLDSYTPPFGIFGPDTIMAVTQSALYNRPLLFSGQCAFVPSPTIFTTYRYPTRPVCIQTKPMDFGESRVRKFFDVLYIEIRKQIEASVFIEVGISDLPEGPITWTSAVDLVDGWQRIPLSLNGRYISLRFSSPSYQPSALTIDPGFILTSFDITGSAWG